MKIHAGQFQITAELLLAAIHFPADTRIVGVRMSDDIEQICFQVEHPDLPEVELGNPLPVVQPQVRQTGNSVTVWETEFAGWGI